MKETDSGEKERWEEIAKRKASEHKLFRSDRAGLSYSVPILDGRFGSDMEIVATKEGLELGGYFTLPWAWVDAAKARLALLLSGNEVLPSCHEEHTSRDDDGVQP